MAALTSSQIELLRRLGAGRSLYSCSDIPHFLEEIVLLSRLQLVTIDRSGTPSVTGDGVAYLSAVKDTSEFGSLGEQASPTPTMVEAPEGQLPLTAALPDRTAGP